MQVAACGELDPAQGSWALNGQFKLHAEEMCPAPASWENELGLCMPPSPRRRWRGRPLRTPGSLPLTAAACTTDQECCCSSVNPPLKNIHLFSHKHNLFPKVEKESHGTGWKHAGHHPGARFCQPQRWGRDPPSPRPTSRKKNKIKKKCTNRENYLSWQDSTFRVSSTLTSYLLSVPFVASCLSRQMGGWRSRCAPALPCGPSSSMSRLNFS